MAATWSLRRTLCTVARIRSFPRETGKWIARRERLDGRVPAVLYGDNQPVVSVSVDMSDLLAHTRAKHFLSKVIDLTLPDGAQCRVVPRQLDNDFYTGKPSYVSFQRWPKDLAAHPQKIPIPIVAHDHEFCPGVKAGGSFIYIFDRWICRVHAEPYPQAIEVDASRLHIGDAIKLSSVALPQHVKPMPRGKLLDPSLVKVVKGA